MNSADANPADVQQALERASAELQNGRLDAAERIYREILARAPGNAAATHFLGACLVQSGRHAEGLDIVARSLALPGAGPRHRHNYALMLAQAGRLADAERELAAVVAAEPDNAPSFHYLGLVRQQLARPADAAVAYRKALELAPANPAFAANYAITLLELGDTTAALEWLDRSLAGDPGNAVAHNTRGSALAANGDRAGAVASFRKAVALNPRYAKAWFNLGNALRDMGDVPGAFEALREAVRTGPDFAPAWEGFATALAQAEFRAWDAAAADEITRVLVREDIDPAPLAWTAAQLLVLEPRFAPVYAALPESREPAAQWLSGNRLRALAHPMLPALIENALVPDPAFETFVVALRRNLLEAWAAGALTASPRLTTLVCALAQQCFLNEYVWPESAAESDTLARLADRAAVTRSEIELAVLACYRRVADLPLEPPARRGAEFARLWRRQVEEPRTEAALRGELRALTAIEDPTSREVRRQYEENPYPRWHRLPATVSGAYPLKRVLADLFPHLDQARLALADPPEILVAGCGTGFQTAVTARRNPASAILAVDLSRTSLAYALRRARELGIANVRFAQADLLQLGGIAQRFDWIECTGVLHHLADPLAGWRALNALLKPGGVMKVALYSEHARRGVVAARALIAAHALNDDLAGIRAARRLVLDQPADSAARGVLRSSDFYSASGARDLMMHVQEHRFTIAGIDAAVRALGLDFIGFEFADPRPRLAYRDRFPDDAPMQSLERWATLEDAEPDLFSAMYQFWVAKPA